MSNVEYQPSDIQYIKIIKYLQCTNPSPLSRMTMIDFFFLLKCLSGMGSHILESQDTHESLCVSLLVSVYCLKRKRIFPIQVFVSFLKNFFSFFFQVSVS